MAQQIHYPIYRSIVRKYELSSQGYSRIIGRPIITHDDIIKYTGLSRICTWCSKKGKLILSLFPIILKLKPMALCNRKLEKLSFDKFFSHMFFGTKYYMIQHYRDTKKEDLRQILFWHKFRNNYKFCCKSLGCMISSSCITTFLHCGYSFTRVTSHTHTTWPHWQTGTWCVTMSSVL